MVRVEVGMVRVEVAIVLAGMLVCVYVRVCVRVCVCVGGYSSLSLKSMHPIE